MVRSQITNLTLGPSFGHNLCFKCPNGSCKLILDIYILRDFQWYKERLNPMSFDPYNCPLKIWESIWESNSQNGNSFGSVRVHSLILFCTPRSMRCDSWASLLACTLASPCLGHEPKVRVATLALGLRPRQRLAKVRTKSEAHESHFLIAKPRSTFANVGVWENGKVGKWESGKVGECEGMNLHTHKWAHTLKVKSTPKSSEEIARVTTHWIKDFLISLEISCNVNVQNMLAWPIWVIKTQVMAKRRATLTPDH
jgi:hypothetical protein